MRRFRFLLLVPFLVPSLAPSLLRAQSPEAWKPRRGAPRMFLEPSRAELKGGATQAFRVRTHGVVEGPLVWSASAFARVDSHGRFTAPREPGTYFVSVQSPRDPGLAAQARVEVVHDPAAAPVACLRPGRVELFPGQAFRFTLEAHGTKGDPVWEGASAQGSYVAPAAPGTYPVRAQWPDGTRAEALVQVVPRPGPGTKVLVAYASTRWIQGHPDFDASSLTHLNIAFARLQDGLCVPGRPEHAGPGGAYAAFRALRSRHPHLKLVLSVGGWGARGFSAMAQSPASRARFIASVLELLRQERLDGLDLDWEYPCYEPFGGVPEDRARFTDLVMELRRAFDGAEAALGRRLVLSAATAGGPDQSAFYEWDRVASQLDFVHAMTYDLHGPYEPFAGFHAPLNPVREEGRGLSTLSLRSVVAAYLAAGVPKGKLVLGVPFYGKGFRMKARPGPGEAAAGETGEEMVFRRLEADYPTDRWQRGWHPEALQPTLWNPARRIWINYDDEASLELKGAFLASQDLAGAMFWELSQDDGRLLRVLARSLGR